MSHTHSIAGFSGRSAPDVRCTAEGRSGLVPTGGSWSLRTVKQQVQQQRWKGYNRGAFRHIGAQCAAAVAGMASTPLR